MNTISQVPACKDREEETIQMNDYVIIPCPTLCHTAHHSQEASRLLHTQAGSDYKNNMTIWEGTAKWGLSSGGKIGGRQGGSWGRGRDGRVEGEVGNWMGGIEKNQWGMYIFTQNKLKLSRKCMSRKKKKGPHRLIQNETFHFVSSHMSIAHTSFITKLQHWALLSLYPPSCKTHGVYKTWQTHHLVMKDTLTWLYLEENKYGCAANEKPWL